MTEDVNKLTELCLKFCNIIKQYTKYIVVSGFFIISSGRSRATEDIDIIIERINLDIFIKIHEDLKKSGFECLQDDDPIKIYNIYLKENIAVRYFQNNDFIPNIEIKLSKDDLDDYQIISRKKVEFTEIDIFFSSIEVNIAFKEELLKSKKDINDAKFLRIVYKDEINKKEIDKVKKMIKKYRL